MIAQGSNEGMKRMFGKALIDVELIINDSDGPTFEATYFLESYHWDNDL